ncbi:MAG: hypothetical protein ABSG34_09435 [Candidatus Sulfotelmatobacter sp.]|jgi:hypothetical protein
MTSIRKFIYATLLAATTLNFAPSLASAQSPAHGKFTLSHDVIWGNAKVPAGQYEFSFTTEGISLLTLSKISGAPAGFMMLVPVTEETKAAAISRLVLETTADGSYVSAMQLPEFGMTLRFNVPAEKQIARVATTASASGQ